MSNNDLLSLLSDLGEVDAEIARLTAEREAIRAAISEQIAAFPGQKAAIPGYGSLAIRAPSVARTWDGEALTELVQSLRETGQGELAAEIEACKKVAARPGGLAITREKRDV